MATNTSDQPQWLRHFLYHSERYFGWLSRCQAILRKAGIPERYIGDDLETIAEQAGLADREFAGQQDFEAALSAWALNRAAELAALRPIPDAPKAGGGTAFCVRLSQAAAMVSRNKRTLAGWQASDKDFPLPVVEGGGGRPAEWEWATLRPYLERKTGKKLPRYHPGDPNRPDFGDATFWETEATDENR
jgi:hypothetical protein